MASEPRSRNRTRTPALSAPAIAPGANAEGPKLSDVANGANKTFGNGMVVSATAFHQNANCIPLGHLVGDLAMLGGIPEGQSAMFIGNEGGGKQCPVDSTVYTPQGPRRLGDIRVGDYVLGSDGKPTRVTGVFPQGVKPCMEIEFNDGRVVEAGPEHLWRVLTAKSVHILTTAGIMDRGWCNSAGNSTLAIPVAHPAQFETPTPDWDGYIIGALIGNGALGDGKPVLSSPDDSAEVVERVRAALPRGYTLTENRSASCPRYYIRDDEAGHRTNRLSDFLRAEGLATSSRHKRIPMSYLFAPHPVRLALLQGLMDTDGTCDSGNRASYSTMSAGLADDVRTLVESLGGTATLRDKTSGEFVVGVRMPVCPFYLPRKARNWSRPRIGVDRRYIRDVRHGRTVEQVCIAVDAPDHLYLMDHFVVTHNTTQAMRCVAAAQRKYPEHTALWVDTEQTFDPTWAEHHGVDLSRLHIAQPVAGEDAVDLLKTACEQAADLCFAVLDSVNQTIPMKEYEESVADTQVALHPRLMGRMSSRMTTSGSVRRQNRWVPVTKIFINQWRYKIGGLVFGDPRTIPGGRQFIHHCSTHLEFKSKLKTAKDDDDMETTSLVEHTINVRRAKIASSIRSGEYQVVVGPDHRLPIGSFDEAGTIVAFAKRIELYAGGGTNQGFNGIGPRFRNMDAAKEWLEANPDQALEIKRMIIMHRREKVGLPPVPPDGFLLRW